VTTVSDESNWTAKGRATRARIVAAAAELMYERGVAGTATEDVLRAAAVSNSQLYHYFADKGDLTRAVIAHQVERVVGYNEAALADLDSFAALEAWRDAMVAIVTQGRGLGGCPIGSLASEIADSDEDARVALVAGFDRWEAEICRGLQAMRDRGVLRAQADPGELALVVLAAHQGGLLLSQARRDPTPLRVALDGAIAYLATFAA
jgi:TetR/AcrR family transcriptional repressor of nem operon